VPVADDGKRRYGTAGDTSPVEYERRYFPREDADKSLDWLCSDTQAPAVLSGLFVPSTESAICRFAGRTAISHEHSTTSTA